MFRLLDEAESEESEHESPELNDAQETEEVVKDDVAAKKVTSSTNSAKMDSGLTSSKPTDSSAKRTGYTLV